MAGQAPSGPFRLVTVNNAPARAKLLIGRVVEDLKERYKIEYVGNCICKEDVRATVEKLQPDVLFCASMWTAEESGEMQDLARAARPGIKTYAIPHGLQVEQGPDAIVAHLKEQIPALLDYKSSVS